MATATRCLLVGGCVAALLLWRQRWAVRFARANLLRCSMCGTLRAPIEFTPRQARRDGTMRKCRPCVAMYVETPRSAADKEARKAARALERSQALAAAEAARDAVSAAQEAAADRIEDPLRLASKAETVLRGRSDVRSTHSRGVCTHDGITHTHTHTHGPTSPAPNRDVGHRRHANTARRLRRTRRPQVCHRHGAPPAYTW